MAEIETKTEAVIHLSNEEVAEIRGWTSTIDWEAHPLARDIYIGLGGDEYDPEEEHVTGSSTSGLITFEKVN